MSQRLTQRFHDNQPDKSLVLFLTAGFPDLETTEALIPELEAAGADVLELGVPFSDPIADGPTIQAASQKALQAGTTLEKILAMVSRLRKKVQMPIILFGAYNPFFHYGLDKLVQRAREVGVDGFLIPDLPIEESGEMEAACKKEELALVQLAALTTPADRIKEIVRHSSGFLYFISMKGVTGAQLHIGEELKEKARQLKEAAGDLPVAIGFGISEPEQAATLKPLADGVVVGSALIRLIENTPAAERHEKIRAYVKSLKTALRD